MINENLPRWIQTSVNKYFKDELSGIVIYLENEDRKKLNVVSKWLELIINGIFINETSKDSFVVDVEIEALCCLKKTNNIYDLDKFSGQVAALFTAIPILKLGNVLGIDDNSPIGCLTLQGKISIVNWGTDSVDVTLSRTAIEGSFQMQI